MRMLAPFAAALALAPSTLWAQSVPIQDLVKDSKPLALNDLTSDYRAVRLSVEGSTDTMTSMFSNPMMLMFMGIGMMTGGGGEGAQMFDLFGMMGLYWTKGETIDIAGQPFLKAYQVTLDMGAMARMSGPASPPMEGAPTRPDEDDEPSDAPPLSGPEASIGAVQPGEPPLPIKLVPTMVRVSSITSISPDVDLTPDEFRERVKRLMEMPASGGMAPGTAAPEGVASGVPVLRDVPLEASAARDRTQDMSNMKQVLLATVIYASDYDDVFPKANSTAEVKAVIMPYCKSEEIFHYSQGMLRFNVRLSGKSMTSLEEPADTPLFWISKPYPDGRMMVGYTDGHVAMVTMEKWREHVAKYRIKE